jgi:hypothetical protein
MYTFPSEYMRARFTFISLLLLVLLAVGYFLSYMAGFLTVDFSGPRQRLLFWRDAGARTTTESVTYSPAMEAEQVWLARRPDIEADALRSGSRTTPVVLVSSVLE